MTPLALNAQPILSARMRGFKPDELVIVSMAGHVHAANHVVRAVAGIEYDWRWVHGIEVCMYVDAVPNWYDTLKAIARQRPASLCVWSCTDHWGVDVYLVPTAEDIAQPIHKWVYELDFLPWMDFQNDDFIEGRTYNRTPEGMPYAVNP